MNVALLEDHGQAHGLVEADGEQIIAFKKKYMSVSLQKYSRRRFKIILTHCSIIGLGIYTMSQCDCLNSKFWHTLFWEEEGITEL